MGISLLLALGLTYVGAWYDLGKNAQVTDPTEVFLKSLIYWADSVLPYWWLPVMLFVVASGVAGALWGLRARGARALGRGEGYPGA